MTQVIDGKVVEMKFNNADFERNVAQSMSTIDKLKNALNFNSVKPLEGLSAAANKVDLSGVGNAVQEVTAQFSALQIVGITALSELTRYAMNLGSTMVNKVLDPIITGGTNRALNIEKAKFQLKGLGIAWKDIEEDINYGVRDTAYGLDAAANAASQFAASGVKLGDEMKTALRGISGVAAMTGASYEEISNIFTTVSGNGKAMASEFNRIGQRGLNAKAAVANFMNGINDGSKQASESVTKSVKEITKGLKVTEADIADFASKGKINFGIFSSALDEAFGEHAKAANETFTGAMDNMRAAFSRIGEMFITPIHESKRLMALDIKDLANTVKPFLKPVAAEVSDIYDQLQKKLNSFVKSQDTINAIHSSIISVGNAFNYLKKLLGPVKAAFNDIFPDASLAKTLRDITLSVERFTSKLKLSQSTGEDIRRTFRGLFAVVEIIGMTFNAAVKSIAPFANDLKGLSKDILGLTGDLGDYLVNVKNTLKANDTLVKTFDKVVFGIRVTIQLLKNYFKALKDAIKDFKNIHLDGKDFSGISGFFERLKDQFKKLGSLGDFIKWVFKTIADAFNGFKPVAQAIGEVVAALTSGVLQGFSRAFGGDSIDKFGTFVNMLTTSAGAGLIMQMANSFTALGKAVTDAGGLNRFFTVLRGNVSGTLKQLQADIKADVLSRLAKAIALLAGSMLVLSMINPTALATSLGAVTGLLIALVAAVEVMEGKFSKNNIVKEITGFKSFINVLKDGISDLSKTLKVFAKAKTMQLIALSLMEVSAAVVILSLAVKVLADSFKDAPAETALAIVGIVGLMGALYAISEFSENQNFDSKGIAKLIAYAASVKILVSALTDLASSLKDAPTETALALGMITVMLGELYAISEFSSNSFKAGTGLALLEAAASIYLIGKAIIMLGELDEAALVQGGIAVGVIGAAVAAFIKFVADMTSLGDMAGIGTAVIALAASIYIVAQAIASLKDMAPEEVGTGLVALGVALVAMGAGLKILADTSSAGDLAATAASLVLLGVAMKLIASSIALLASQDPASLTVGLGALVITIGMFALAAIALQPVIPMLITLGASLVLLGVSVLALGAGLVLLATAVEMFVKIGPDFITVMAELSVALLAFAGLALVLQPALIPMLALAGVVAAIGVAALAAGGGIMLCALGLSTMASIGVVGSVAIEAVALALTKLSAAVVLFAVNNHLVVAAILELTVTLALFLVDVVATAAALLSLVVASGVSAISMTAFAVATGIAAVAVAGLATAISLLFLTISSLFPGLVKFNDSVTEFFDGIKQKFTDGFDDIINSVKDKISMFELLGQWLMQGFMDGIMSIPVVGTVIGIVSDAIAAIKNTQDSNSPSKVTEALGEDFGIGYGQGMDKTKPDIENSASSLATAATDKMDASAEAEVAAENTVNGYIGGLLGMIPGVQDAAAQVSAAAVITPTIEEPEWNMHEVTAQAARDKEYKAAQRNAKARNEAIRQRNESIKGIEKETDAVKKETEAEEENTKATGKNSKAKSEKKDVISSLKSTLENQMDIFSKFELKTGVTSETMLENMKSNLDGFASWSARLAKLTERGISKALWEKLAEMGPKGYETLNAFVNMTDEQLAQANEMFTASLAMDEAVTAQLIPGYRKLGGDIPAGLVEGLEAEGHQVADANVKMMEAGLEAAKETVDSNSPAKEYEKIGIFCIEGLRLGFSDIPSLTFLENTTRIMLNLYLLDPVREQLSGEVFKEIGTNAVLGLSAGFEDEEAIAKLTETSGKLAEIILNLIAGHEGLDEHSPSKALYEVGALATKGLANGIKESAGVVYEAAKSLTDGTMKAFDPMGRIVDTIDTSLDFNPVITPLLDLSTLNEQMSEVNSLFSRKSIGVQVDGEMDQNGGQKRQQQITFNQYNNSPKALSTIDIYRNTKMQLGVAKGVVRG